MRHSRFTYVGVYHHVMNRGDKGENIFSDKKLKIRFLQLLQETYRQTPSLSVSWLHERDVKWILF